MIDTSTWKEFRVGDLFTLERGKCSKVAGIETGNIPYVGCTNRNNGILGYYDFDADLISKGNCIVFIGNGNGSAGQQIYKEEDFVSSTGNVMGYRDGLNKYNAGFVVSVMDKIQEVTQEFSHANGRTLDKLSEQIISLPATPDGQPDWDYMESYMKTIMEESEKSLENLKKADDTKHLIDVSGWGEFRVGDLFDVSRPSSRSSQNYDEGDMPFVASGNFNNGVTAYLQPKDDNDYDEGGCITVSAVDGYAFYQKGKFLGRGGAGSSIMMLRNDNLNEMNGKYVCTLIRKACSNWEYSNMGNKDKLADTMIWLPITANGEPDWQYMEDYMKQIMDKSEQAISKLQIGA